MRARGWQRRRRDRHLYARYGEVMRTAQGFDLTVRQLAMLDEPDDAGDADDGGLAERVERLFRRPLAKLARRLGVDEELAGELQVAVNTRNTLAHDFLLTSFLNINVGISSHREEIATLDFALVKYRELAARLDEIVQQRHVEQGIAPEELDVTAADMRRILGNGDDGPESSRSGSSGCW